MNHIRKLGRFIDAKILRFLKFWSDFVYYLDRGHRIGMAWELARSTL